MPRRAVPEGGDSTYLDRSLLRRIELLERRAFEPSVTSEVAESFPRYSGRVSTSQTVASGTMVDVVFGTEIADTGGFTQDGQIFRIPWTGQYLLSARLAFTATNSTQMLRLLIDGSGYDFGGSGGVAASTAGSYGAWLEAGTFVRVQAWQVSGGGADMTLGSATVFEILTIRREGTVGE